MKQTSLSFISVGKGLFCSALLINSVFASLSYGQQETAPLKASANVSLGAAQAPTETVLDALPELTRDVAAAHPAVPRPRTGVSEAEYQARKDAAYRQSLERPSSADTAPRDLNDQSEIRETPGASAAFQGQTEFCSGLTPSDMGLAVGQTQVVQVVNACISVYSKTGSLFGGYPKSLNSFFGLPASAFTFDPRALYDWAHNRFIVIADEARGKQGFIHVAASSSADATSSWHVYHLAQGALGDFVDFPTLGQGRTAIYVGYTNFLAGGGISNVVLYLPKAQLFSGAGFSFFFGFNFNVGGVRVDSIQPANVQEIGDKPRAEFMVNSFNINFGSGQCSSGCNGLVVWAVSNPLVISGSPGPEISGVVIPTARNYSLPPAANEPGKANAIDTGDTRISGEVTYAGGSLYAALGTAAAGPGATVTWYRINPVLNDGNSRCTGAFANACADITSATSINEEECYLCSGRGASGSNFFGTLAVDSEQNTTLVYNYSDNNTFPGTAYTSRRVTARTLHDVGIFLESGAGSYSQSRWGDYTGVAVDLTNPFLPSLWFSGMYSRSDGNWGTVIGSNLFSTAVQP